MAIKKSELYSSLWAMCDELRGGMDASQYKDYVLVLLFLKYISDKYAGKPYAPIEIPKGATFKDMVALKGKATIGDDINKKIIAPLQNANKLTGMPDFNDPEKLGSGKDMVDRLTGLIAIFERKELDFSRNRADGDDLLGDAYEYLMRHFATESGKSKGQFYTPAEVSRTMAQLIGIDTVKTTPETTVYDPTCGSGSLLLKVADQANSKVSLYGQEKDSATAGLARMNMILHDNPEATIRQTNTLANPHFLTKDNELQTFDFVIANPPFSDKRWGNGVDLEEGPHKRFKTFGLPPAKNGDYAYLLHIVLSLKSRGKGACILPHGVLFRGNTEAVIRTSLIQKHLIKGIIGLPANLFYGTGIPACIVVIDKEQTQSRRGIFMIDASKGFIKDGNKNRLRERDIHRIVDVFTNFSEVPGYSRMVGYDEIEKNDWNLNIPRYIDSTEVEDLQDIEAHLHGGIPEYDIKQLAEYWNVMPQLQDDLFDVLPNRPGYYSIKVGAEEIRTVITKHEEFVSFAEQAHGCFQAWKEQMLPTLRSLQPEFNPKKLIRDAAERLLLDYKRIKLISEYEIYQHLMSFWYETMQDDAYLITAEGWQAQTYRILEKNSKGKEVDKGWTCDLVPKALVIKRFFEEDQEAIHTLESELESLQARKTEIEEEQNGEEGAFAELEKINKGSINTRIKELKGDAEAEEELRILQEYLGLIEEEGAAKKKLKTMQSKLDTRLYDFYPNLTEEQIKLLVIEDKWLAGLKARIDESIDQIALNLNSRLKELTERYEHTLPALSAEVEELSKAVDGHLERMGFAL